jgi:hypothetical protein
MDNNNKCECFNKKIREISNKEIRNIEWDIYFHGY